MVSSTGLLKIVDGGIPLHEAVTQEEVSCGLKRASSPGSTTRLAGSGPPPFFSLRRSIDLANPHRGGASGCGGQGTPYRKGCTPAPPLEKKNSREDGEGVWDFETLG